MLTDEMLERVIDYSRNGIALMLPHEQQDVCRELRCWRSLARDLLASDALDDCQRERVVAMLDGEI